MAIDRVSFPINNGDFPSDMSTFPSGTSHQVAILSFASSKNGHGVCFTISDEGCGKAHAKNTIPKFEVYDYTTIHKH